MSLIAVASAKFSPGASTLAELLVLRRPGEQRCLLVDCDPSGSEWRMRGAAAEPGLVTLAVAGRRELAPAAALGHIQTVGEGMEVLVAPAAARQVTGALEVLGDRLGLHLASLGAVDVVADCGRLAPGSPALGVVAAADLVVLVSRAAATDVIHVAPWVDELSGGPPVSVVLVGGRRGGRQLAYGPSEVAEGVGAPVLGVVAEDPAAAARLFTQPGSLASLSRSQLVRSASSVASAVFAAAVAEQRQDRGRVDPKEALSR